MWALGDSDNRGQFPAAVDHLLCKPACAYGGTCTHHSPRSAWTRWEDCHHCSHIRMVAVPNPGHHLYSHYNNESVLSHISLGDHGSPADLPPPRPTPHPYFAINIPKMPVSPAKPSQKYVGMVSTHPLGRPSRVESRSWFVNSLPPNRITPHGIRVLWRQGYIQDGGS